MTSEYLYSAFNLLIVLGIMFFLFFLLKKFKLKQRGQNKFINVVQIVPLGSKEKIILVDVNQSLILLGATANQISTLHVFNEMDSKDLISEINVAPKFSLLDAQA